MRAGVKRKGKGRVDEGREAPILIRLFFGQEAEEHEAVIQPRKRRRRGDRGRARDGFNLHARFSGFLYEDGAGVGNDRHARVRNEGNFLAFF